MAVVLRSACPSCQKPLTIPADWVGQAMRCKHCGGYMLSRRRSKGPAAAMPMVEPVPMPLPLPQQAAPTWEPLPEYTPPIPAAMPQPAVAPLPNYQQPAYPAQPWPTAPVAPAAPPPTAAAYAPAFDTRERYAGRGNYRGPKKRAWLKPVVFGVIFLGLLGGAGVIWKMNPDLFKEKPEEEPAIAQNNDTTKPASKSGSSAESTAGTFPRRMLAISVHSYLYANSLHNGDTGRAFDANNRTGTDAAIRKLAERWRVPADQFYHLTDAPMITDQKTEPKKGAMASKPSNIPMVKQPPMKNVMEGAIQQFLEGSREQDRIVLLYCGHAIEKGGEVYLTPMEGDFDELESLVPLKTVYEQLAACKAQEKLVVFDVCRFHPERGAERPHAGPMSEALEKGLHAAPAGVSVVTSCSKGEHSYELDYTLANGKYALRGSFFLSLFPYAAVEGILAPEGKLPAPADPIPVERLISYEQDQLSLAVKARVMGKTQTPKITLNRRPEGEMVAYNASEPLPSRFEFPTPPPSADPKAVRSIIAEIELPPVKAYRSDSPPPGIPDVLPFRKEVLEEFLDDTKKPDEMFKKTIEDAVAEMRRLKEGSENELKEEFGGETSEAAKKELQADQKAPAIVEASLREQYENLRGLEKMKASQPKRWQAHYDYVYSQVLYRICYTNQYNLALANVRTGKIPDLADGQDGYRLTSETTLDKATQKEFKQYFDEAKKISNELAKNYAGTPWALLAKSDRTLAIGLRVSPTSLGKVTR